MTSASDDSMVQTTSTNPVEGSQTEEEEEAADHESSSEERASEKVTSEKDDPHPEEPAPKRLKLCDEAVNSAAEAEKEADA